MSNMSMNSVYERNLEQENYLQIRQFTEQLAAPLSEADAQLQSMADTSPTKWHLAHTSWFFETFVLCEYLSGYRHMNETYNHLFNSYYNGIGEQYSRPHRGMISRPSMVEIMAYREHVDSKMCDLLAGSPMGPGLQYLIELGLNHEQQHQELLLTDIKHALYQNPLYPVYKERAPLPDIEITPIEYISIPQGIYEIGNDGKNFCFDNETPMHKQFINNFQIATRPINNKEYLEFIKDNGYQRPELWLSDGWTFINQHNHHQPLYWLKKDDQWFQFTLAGVEPLNMSSPVTHINFYEANAFANWSGKRLPTEAEWEVAAQTAKNHGHLNDFHTLHPAAMQMRGLHQMIGDVWEWSASSYSPYPEFKITEGAVGEYNGKFMANQYVLRGASCVTSEGHARITYRNFFYAHQSWQFTGIRLASSD